jgi:RND superfamily putative drug exporter
MIRRLSVPIVLFWLVLAAITNVAVPQLEAVGAAHNVAMSPQDAPSLQAMKHMGKAFHEFDSDSAAMIVLEGDQPLGEAAHRFYDTLIHKLSLDTKHVQHIQDFWGDPLTAAGSQSADGKAAYVQVYLAGNQGESLSIESVDAVRDIVAHTPPPGVKAASACCALKSLTGRPTAHWRWASVRGRCSRVRKSRAISLVQ